MCDIWREKPGQNLTAEDIERLSPEWRDLGVRTVVICGESLMHPDVWPIVERIKAHGIRLELLSNGLLLERNAAQVARYCDELRVSLDGPPEVHDVMRNVPRAYTRLQAGISALLSRDHAFPVFGRCAIHRQNFRHLAATVATAKALGLKGISFSGTDVWNEEAFRRMGAISQDYVAGLAIIGPELDDLAAELAAFRVAAAAEFASGYISDTPERLDEIVLGYYRSIDAGLRRDIKCNAPWTSTIIEYDGTLRPCFPMPAYGNIRAAGSLSAGLNSPGAQEFRRGLDVTTNPTCQRCVDQTVN
jgi:Fe-coproporphyrin III synthase